MEGVPTTKADIAAAILIGLAFGLLIALGV
jgi:hypothetical protein